VHVSDASVLLDHIRADPDSPLIITEGMRPDGRILLRFNGLTTTLNRWLYTRAIRPLEPTEFLHLREGYEHGDQNPHHWYISHRKTVSCPSGHRYPEDQPSGPCVACAALRRALTGPDAAEIRRMRTHCPRMHEYTPANTRVFTDRNGYKHRACRECQRERD